MWLLPSKSVAFAEARKFSQAQIPEVILISSLSPTPQTVSNFPPRHIWQPIAEHRPASGHQGPRSMAPTTSLTSSLLPLLPPHCTFLTIPHTWQSHICLRVCALAVLISPLPLGLCSNIISIEKPTSTVPFKDCPPNPGAFYSFFFKAPNTTTQINF